MGGTANGPNRPSVLTRLRPTRRHLTPFERELYDHVPAPLLARVRIVTVPFVPGGYAGITLGSTVFLKKSQQPDGFSVLLAHELVHVRQWNELGMTRFLQIYLGDFVSGLRIYRSWNAAYRAIRLETEARNVANEWHFRRNAGGA